MKKRIAIVCMLMLGVSSAMTACGGDSADTTTEAPAAEQVEDTAAEMDEAEATDTAEATDEADTADEETENAGNDTAKETVSYDMPAEYQAIVDKYQTMISEKWDMGKAFEEEMSGMVPELVEMGYADQIGYTLYDLDNDGQPELLIGEMDTELPQNRIILDAYTSKDGQAVQLFESESRNRYYLIEDEAGPVLIANEGSNGAASSGWIYSILSDGKLEVQQAIMYDAAADENNPWFMAYDDDWDTSNDEQIDENTANSIIDSYIDSYAALDWTPFSN